MEWTMLYLSEQYTQIVVMIIVLYLYVKAYYNLYDMYILITNSFCIYCATVESTALVS